MSPSEEGEDPRLARLAAQRIAGPGAGSVEEVVGHLLALQAQNERGVRLAVRSRSAGLSASDVDRALTEDRTVLVTWLNRGTLHLVSTEDYWWLHPLTAPRVVAGNERRLRQLGVAKEDAELGIEVIVASVTSEGPLSRSELRHRLDRVGVPTAGQALIHLLVAASLRGLVVRGPVVDGEHAYVSVSDWIGRAPPVPDPSVALGMLARRYLTGHGPASARDLATWAGITLSDARRGLASVSAELVESPSGVRLAAAPVAPGRFPPPRLLGSFDPLLHGWQSRAPFVGDHAGVVTSNGIFRPILLAGGRVVATWSLPGGVVTIDPLERIAPRDRRAVTEDALDVQRFLGLPPGPVDFR
jgi:hypothetical protein